MNTTYPNFWAVQITRKDGTSFFSNDANAPCGMWKNRADAIKRAEELRKVLKTPKSRIKTVKVTVTVETSTNPKK